MSLNSAEMVDAQHILTNEGVEAFYQFLYDKGEEYGRLALGVTRNDTWQGELANGFAASRAIGSGRDLAFGSNDWLALNGSLAEAHLAAYDANDGGTPSWDQIQGYHNTIYDGFGLVPDAWFPNNLLDSANDPGLLWDDYLENDSSFDLYEDAFGILASSGQYLFGGYLFYAAASNGELDADKVAFARSFLNAFAGLSDSALDDLVAEANLLSDIAAWLRSVPADLRGTLEDLTVDYGWASQNIGIVADEVLEALGLTKNEASPLVIDLDRDGLIELTTFDSLLSTAWFDLDSDGFAEQTAWVSADDGFLARDINQNGRIDNNGELFGSPTIDGFTILAELDSNSDLVIDANDDAWDELIIWRDISGDGVSQSDELFELSDFNIVSISLANVETSTDVINGNPISHTSTVTYADTTTGSVVDAWFVHDQAHTRFVGDYTLDIRALFLPTMRGYGELADLHIAMSMDNSGTGNLLEQVQGLATQSLVDLAEAGAGTLDDIRSMLFKWAGVEGVSPTSRGIHVDARELAFLEALSGEPYLQRGIYSDPGTAAGAGITAAFNTYLNSAIAQVLIQSAGKDLFAGEPSYNISSDEIAGVTGLNLTTVDDLETSATALATGAEKEAFWENVMRLIEGTVGLDELSSPDAAALNDAMSGSGLTPGQVDDITDRIGYEGLEFWTTTGTSSDDVLVGTAGNDELVGNDGNDTLSGYGGIDTLNGGNGNDVLNGGTGNDLLLGGAGDDSYLYAVGDGIDVIRDTYGDDRIIFGAGIALADLSFSTAGDRDLIVDLAPTAGGGQITIEEFYGNIDAGDREGRVETLEFDDTTTFDLNSLGWTFSGTAAVDTLYGYGGNDTLQGLEGNDTLYGSGGEDLLDGGAGNDNLYGGAGSDTLLGSEGNDQLFGNDGDDILDGGAGSDTFNGGAGNDTYLFSLGDAPDTGYEHITEVVDSGTDTILFSAGISTEDVHTWTTIEGHLMVEYQSGSTIRVAGQTYSSGGPVVPYVERIEFDDETVWTFDSGLYLRNNDASRALYGSNFGDVIWGGAGSNTIHGYDGDDSLYGEDGPDTLFGGAGNDLLVGGTGTDDLEGGSGDDDYFFALGDSAGLGDEITETISGGTDRIIFDAAIDAEDVHLWTDVYGHLYVAYSETDLVTVWGAKNTSGETLVGQRFEQIVFADETVWDLAAGLTLRNNDVGRYVYGSAFSDMISGGAGVDRLYGYGGNDTLFGGGGNDLLYGGNGDDLLAGEAGNDTLRGEAGADTYFIDISDGSDTIYEAAGSDTDTVEFGAGILPEDILLWTTYHGDLYVQYAGSQILTIDGSRNTSTGETLVYTHVERIAFADETVWDLTAGLTLRNNDTGREMRGTLYADHITGGAARDTIYGHRGDDVISGGGEYDILYGGEGDDTYLYDVGDSPTSLPDIVYEYVGEGTDRIAFEEGILSSDVTMWASNNNFYIRYSASDTIRLIVSRDGAGQTRVGEYIEEVAFDDSTVIDLTGGLTMTGTTNNDTIHGTAYADTIHGSAGVDTLYGYGGDDVLYGGNHNDNLYGGAGADTFVFKSGDSGTDTVWDFSLTDDDKLDVSELLTGYDPLTDAIEDFVRLTDSGANSILAVDADGAGGFTNVATLRNITGLTDEQDLLTNGHLLAA